MDADHPISNTAQPTSGYKARLNAEQTRDLSADQSDPLSGGDENRSVNHTRVTVAQAAKLLGLSTEAIRSRVRRGTLHSERVGGTVYVLLHVDQTQTGEQPTNADTTGQPVTQPETQTTMLPADQTYLVTSLEEQVSFLRSELLSRNEELRRKDHIIAALTDRIPELPAPRASQGKSEAQETTSAEGATEGAVPPPHKQKPEKRHSWLYRFFFGP